MRNKNSGLNDLLITQLENYIPTYNIFSQFGCRIFVVKFMPIVCKHPGVNNLSYRYYHLNKMC